MTQLFVGHDAVQGKTGVKQVDVEIEKGTVGLFVKDADPAHGRPDGNEQKQRNNAAENLQILVHGNCQQITTARKSNAPPNISHLIFDQFQTKGITDY